MTKKRKRTKKLNRAWLIVGCLTILGWVFIGFTKSGAIGVWTDQIMNYIFGLRRDVLYLVITLLAIDYAFLPSKWALKLRQKIVLSIAIILLYLWTAYFVLDNELIGQAMFNSWFSQSWDIYTLKVDSMGGLLGVSLYSFSTYLLGRLGTLFFLMSVSLGLILYLLEFRNLKKWFTKETKSKVTDISKFSDIEPQVSAQFLSVDDSPKKTQVKNEPLVEINMDVKTRSAATIHTIGNYSLPSLNLLDPVNQKNKSSLNQNAAHAKGQRLLEILSEFGVNATLVATHIGPSVTKFEVRPDSNVKISKINSIQDNLKMELAAKELRLEAPIPGRNAVGIEIPNLETIPVRLIEMMRDISKEQVDKKLLYPIGKDLMGKSIFAEMDKMPHMLVAGATGSGKSVFMNVMIVNYLLRTSPDELKMLLIDPKKVEFAPFVEIPHLIAPVISDAAEAARALKIIVNMMENRYEVFSNVGVRNISAYNEMIIKKPQDNLELMPWILVVIDELADLMIVAGKDVEGSIQRITQLARAAGIHLVVATQRPSTDVITGIIKANIPSRIAFEVSNGIDSRTILDQVGAERLLGKGDMLFYPVGEPAPMRVQGSFISDDEVHRIAKAVSEKRKPQYDESFLNIEQAEDFGGISSKMDDPLYSEVKDYILETGRASTSNIQRRFGLGYNRAARMIDQMEKEGLVGPANGSKPRDVYK